MTTNAIKDQIIKLTRREQADIVHFIMDIMVSEEDFELSLDLKAEIDASYNAIENGTDEGLTHELYRKKMDNLLSNRNKS